MKKCAKCKCDMDEISLLDYQVDFCANCKSVFLEENELELVNNGQADRFENTETFGKRIGVSDKTEIICPSCTNLMNEFVFAYDSNIFIDKCNNCGGIFLDAGELSAIDNFLEKVDKENLPTGVKKALDIEKNKIDAKFSMMEAENDKLYKVIDEIPGIKYVANFLAFFLMK